MRTTDRLLLLPCCALVCSAVMSHAASKDLRGVNWAEKGLQNENLKNADLSNATLTRANLRNAVLKQAILAGTDLTGAVLREADLTEADLRGAKLANAVLQDATFTKANLEGDQVFLAYGNPLDEKKVKSASHMADYGNVVATNLIEHNGNISFKKANLQRAAIHGSLEEVDFSGADLRGADLSDTKDAAKAHFRGALYDANTRWPGGFNPAEANAKLGDSVPNESTSSTSAASPFTGKWRILPEPGGATEDGVLTIHKNGTFDWDTSVKAKIIVGTWKLAGNGILLSKGENGRDWSGSIKEHGEYSSALQLRSSSGNEERWGAPAGSE